MLYLRGLMHGSTTLEQCDAAGQKLTLPVYVNPVCYRLEHDVCFKIDIKKYVSDTVGLPTLTDIMQELDKPGRDPRQQIQVFEFDKNVRTIDDLKEGMILPGIINNITNFGCFVDIGIKENGLVHVSRLCREFVSDPSTVVRIHQHVQVKVMTIDKERKRIQSTMILD